MSSLRPLATITLLAAVGVVLYMKINETEPVIPAGVGQWTDAPLDVGGDGGALAPNTLPPAYAPDAAPAFAPSATAGASGSANADEAPAWSPGPLPPLDPVKQPEAPLANADSSPIARTAEPQTKLPEMPPLPKASDAKEPVAESPAPPFTPPAVTETSPAEGKHESESAVAATEPSTPSEPITPTDSAPASLYPAARVAVQGALDRGELAQALLLLTDWYGDPSLTPAETQEVNTLLGQLAGSVIYDPPPAHRLEPAYIVQAGETLYDVAGKYDVPWQLLAKINGVAQPDALQPGQELKVFRGPFSALVDLSERRMTLMLDRRYAGQFAIELDPAASIEEGQWNVDQKLLTPGGAGLYSTGGVTEDKSLLLANPASPSGQAVVLRGPGGADPISAQPAGRVIRLKSGDINDVYDILSEKSRVTVRR